MTHGICIQIPRTWRDPHSVQSNPNVGVSLNFTFVVTWLAATGRCSSLSFEPPSSSSRQKYIRVILRNCHRRCLVPCASSDRSVRIQTVSNPDSSGIVKTFISFDFILFIIITSDLFFLIAQIPHEYQCSIRNCTKAYRIYCPRYVMAATVGESAEIYPHWLECHKLWFIVNVQNVSDRCHECKFHIWFEPQCSWVHRRCDGYNYIRGWPAVAIQEQRTLNALYSITTYSYRPADLVI